MTRRIEDVRLLDDLRFRRWNSAIADVWTVDCGPNASGKQRLYCKLFVYG